MEGTSEKGPVSEESKRELLEKYGLNPDEFLSEPSSPKVITSPFFFQMYLNEFNCENNRMGI